MIIGFAGCAQAGKTTAATYLEERYNFRKLSFADPLYEQWAHYWKMPMPKTQMQRAIAKRLPGTRDWLKELGKRGREVHQDIWVGLLAMRRQEQDHIAIDDVRYQNETRWIQSQGGYVIRLRRKGVPLDSDEAHIYASSFPHDIELSNNKTIEALYSDVDLLCQKFF